MKSRTIIATVAMVAVIIGAVSAAFTFTQRFPVIPATPPPPALASNCGDPANLVTTTASVVAQSPVTGYILFTCPEGVAALSTSATGGTATPTFTLPAGYDSLGLVAHSAGTTTCTGASLGISSGSATTFFPNEDWDYCASYSTVPLAGLAAFDIVWNG